MVMKEQVVREIDSLPPHLLDIVYRFIVELHKDRLYQINSVVENDSICDDPLKKYIGGVSHGGISSNIDQELYGI